MALIATIGIYAISITPPNPTLNPPKLTQSQIEENIKKGYIKDPSVYGYKNLVDHLLRVNEECVTNGIEGLERRMGNDVSIIPKLGINHLFDLYVFPEEYAERYNDIFMEMIGSCER